jgi:heparan-alpha-glucosaminide N-acetyltransferase
MEERTKKSNRVLSIDIMRGLTLFLMLFVNDLYGPGVPQWMMHTEASVDGMGLADWVFPGFLFMVGISIPYAFQSRIQQGQSKTQIFGHILIRTLSLLIIGILMYNSGRLNPALSGISKNTFALLMYVSVFLIWNKYPDSHRWKKLFQGLKILGIAGLIILAVVFRAGEAGNVSWMETGWWGILGLIGWGYFTAATAYLLIGPKPWATLLVWLFFIALNCLSLLGLLSAISFIDPVFGVIKDGNVPSIVLAGLLTSLIIRQNSSSRWKTAGLIFLLGIVSLSAGFILRNWFIISKIYATPSWAQICNGISLSLFAILFLLIDIYGKNKWFVVFKPAGQNSLTTYLAPDILYHLIWGLSIPLFFYKQDSSQWLAVGGSLVWAFAMVGFAALLAKINIRLKL